MARTPPDSSEFGFFARAEGLYVRSSGSKLKNRFSLFECKVVRLDPNVAKFDSRLKFLRCERHYVTPALRLYAKWYVEGEKSGILVYFIYLNDQITTRSCHVKIARACEWNRIFF